MNGLLPVLLVVCALVVVVAAGVLSWRAQQRRRAALFAFATARGWSYQPGRFGLDQHVYRGEPFESGTSRTVSNVITGSWNDVPLQAFDYTYVTESRDSKGNTQRTTHRYVVCLLTLPAYLPRLVVRPENVLTRAGSALGVTSDIELESDDFNRAFRVKAQDRKFASDVLHPRTMEHLLASRHLTWRIDGLQIVLWEQGRIDPVRLLEHASLLHRVVTGIPAFVWRDHGVDPSTLPTSEGPR